MYLNKSAIEWCDYTANPVRGKCQHDCHYCYMKAMNERFKPKYGNGKAEVTFHSEVLNAIRNHKKPATIFVGSSHDLFGDWCDQYWIDQTLKTGRASSHYIFLTKNPARLPIRQRYFPFPNQYFGASIDTVERAKATNPYMDRLDFLSIEPLLEDVAYDLVGNFRALIIGAQTGKGAIRPEKEWVEHLIELAEDDCKVFIKDNLLKLYPELSHRRELLWPLFTKGAK